MLCGSCIARSCTGYCFVWVLGIAAACGAVACGSFMRLLSVIRTCGSLVRMLGIAAACGADARCHDLRLLGTGCAR